MSEHDPYDYGETDQGEKVHIVRFSEGPFDADTARCGLESHFHKVEKPNSNDELCSNCYGAGW